MVQVDKRSHLVLFKQNQRKHYPYTSELQKASKTDHLVNRHNMMGTISKLYVSNNTWIYVFIKKLDKISTPIPTPTPESFNSNSNSNSGSFNSNSGKSLEYQLQLQLRRFHPGGGGGGGGGTHYVRVMGRLCGIDPPFSRHWKKFSILDPPFSRCLRKISILDPPFLGF